MAESCRFHVFLSFRGEDTRCGFTGHLYAAFRRKGIDAFIDENLEQGNDLNVLFERIEQSKIVVVIFSENYADSYFCLEEITKSLRCRKKKGQVVVPVFYKVTPSQVKRQEGSFSRPFEQPEASFPGMEARIPAWKKALTAAAKLKGYTCDANCSEANFIEEIVKDVLKRLDDMYSADRKDLFGIRSRLEKLEEKLGFGSGGVRIVGVLGMGGIGKSTLADCVYRRQKQGFDGPMFCPNVRVRGSGERELEQLQKELLSKLLDDDNLDIGSPDSAHETLKRRLLNKKMLIVLDDVNKEEQIEVLLGKRDWLKEGSRIIITTRDKKLLKNLVDHIYVVPKLDDGDALDLFSYYAFSNHVCPKDDFMVVSKKFLDFAKGNPLALKVLGSDLRGPDKEKTYWEEKLGKLQNSLDRNIQKILETSYDELKLEQKDVFLDVACFFRSENEDYVRSLVDDTNAIDDLTDKCLITISDDRIEMHDLLHTMGKEIGYQSSVRRQGKRHRLWKHEDIFSVLRNKTGTEEIRGMFLDMSEVNKASLSSGVFKRMQNLRYLKFYSSHCSRGCEKDCKFQFSGERLEYLSDELRYLHWQGFPFKNLPSGFSPKNLVDLKLPYSHIEQLWDDNQESGKLKWIDLSHSRNLSNLSFLSKAQNLERLNLEGCTSLTKLPSSIKIMDKLDSLNLRECTSLASLPRGINLRSLKTLILSGCSKLQNFRLISRNIEALYLDGTAIEELHLSGEDFCELAMLDMRNCSQLKHLHGNLCELKSLEELTVSGCSSLESFPKFEEGMKSLENLHMDNTAINTMPGTLPLSNLKTFSFGGSKGLQLPPLSGLSSLTNLYLTGCNIESLQDSIKELCHLKWLDLKHCKKLRSLPTLPTNLQYLDAHDCESLETVASPLTAPMATERVYSTFIFTNCLKLDENAKCNIKAHAEMKSQLMSDALKRYNQGFSLEPLVGACFPGNEIPLWFHHKTIGSLLKPRLLPHCCDHKFVRLALCAVVSIKDYDNHGNRLSVKCTCEFINEDGSPVSFSCTLGGWSGPGGWSTEPRRLERDHVFLGYSSCFHITKCHKKDKHDRWCYKEASFKFYATDDTSRKLENCEVVKCGLSLLYEPDEKDIHLPGNKRRKLLQT